MGGDMILINLLIIKGLVVGIDKYAVISVGTYYLSLFTRRAGTPVEYRLVYEIVANMQEQIKALGKLQDTLMEGGQAVLEKNVARK